LLGFDEKEMELKEVRYGEKRGGMMVDGKEQGLRPPDQVTGR
jgi:hypothetical protein